MLLRLLVTLIVVGMLVLPEESQAMWAKLNDTELIAQSSVIVMAEFIGETQITLPQQRMSLRLGVLQVTDYLLGTGMPSLLLLVLPSVEGVRSSTDISYQKGQRGLWFLRPFLSEGNGLYLADHPQRFLSATDAPEHITTIRHLLQSRQ